MVEVNSRLMNLGITLKYLGILFMTDGKGDCEMPNGSGQQLGYSRNAFCLLGQSVHLCTYDHKLLLVMERTRFQVQYGVTLCGRMRNLAIWGSLIAYSE